MKKILVFLFVTFLFCSVSFAYTTKGSDKQVLKKAYEKIDIIYNESPEKIQQLDARLLKLQKKYSADKRLSYLLSKIAVYVESLLVEGPKEEFEMKYQTDIEIMEGDNNTYFQVNGERLYMNGVINSYTPKLVYKIFKDHDIKKIIMQDVPGSADDDANLELAAWIFNMKLTIVLEDDSHIASGGTDFFLAGAERIIYDGAKIGIHSWADNNGSVATDYSVGDQVHDVYINYYIELGFARDWAEEFYYFTINAAPADDIYYMTNDEIKEYGIVTEDIKD